jgi:hypothetical protein
MKTIQEKVPTKPGTGESTPAEMLKPELLFSK